MVDRQYEEMNDEQKDIMKQALKEALKEWMNEKFTEFGRWSFYSIMAAILTCLGYFVFVVIGLHK